MDSHFVTRTLTIVTAIFTVCFLHSNHAAVDAVNVKCTYNSVISNFNRKAHENGQAFYYECDERTGTFIERMCSHGESFDVKKLVNITQII